jgi:hypothetical protein
MAKAAANKARGETAFPQAGDGVVLRYRNSDLKLIESSDVGGPAFFNRLIDSILAGTMTFDMLDVYVKHGAKKDGQPIEVDLDSIDMPIFELWELIGDSVCHSMRGKSLKEYIGEITKLLAEDDEPDPKPGLESPSSTTSEPDAGKPAGSE